MEVTPMPTLTNTITIAAPVKRVFHLACDIEHIPEWFVGASQFANVNQTDNMLDSTWDWSYRILGWPRKGQATLVECDEPQRSATEITGDFAARFVWTYKALDGETLVESSVDYDVPMGPIGRLVDALVGRRAFASNLERSLENLKRACEG
jgi:uncharacterized membrane protein